jgi:hypothetical protein
MDRWKRLLVNTGGMRQLRSSHPLQIPFYWKFLQQILEPNLLRLPPSRIPSTISGASSVSRSTRLM